ncbi:ATP12 ATPase [Methylocella silvestris BL2]|uniref:ATP12 ATPase n=1 Tax=Methylocella silvestris (strain DSM 15510 / CIP 108128 / LMG 27833 / NCIMB 13906 / BL2) TaxID=395965 RepID=B8ERI8_METSB|nr:ATP12 family protein [Methylocella silvestris]ACK51040.1 ATP12 ATPase [Methylocella silvestris BL2]
MSSDEKQPGNPARKTIRDDLARAPGEVIAIDPVEMARRDLKKSLPRRFYSHAAAAPCASSGEGAFALLLDGRPARTPARNPLALPTLEAAEAIAAEWERQQELIDPGQMPLTRIANSAIDGVSNEMDATIADIAQFGGSDLICYRAGEPEALALAEAAAWDPMLNFAREKLGARLICAQGVNYVEQPEPARRAVLQAVREIARPEAGGAFALAALHVMTTLTGSALLALAVAHGALTAEEAWAAAHVDEDYQMQLWGADEAALARRARRWSEMEAAARLLRAARPPESAPA